MVTTTEALTAGPVRCPTCGSLARGGVLVNSRGLCCLKNPKDREIAESMVGDAPEPVEELPALVAADPFKVEPKRGAPNHPTVHEQIAVRVAAKIRSMYMAAKTTEERARYRQATGEATRDALA